MLWVWVLVVVGVVVVVSRRQASAVYDAVIIRLTKEWYKKVLGELAEGSNVLDIGVGTATALAENADLVDSKKLVIRGVDYEPAYVYSAKKRCAEDPRLSRVRIECASVYDRKTLEALAPSGGFDAVYFSGSLTLMPDPPQALGEAARLLKPNGSIHVTQTYQRATPFLLPTLKPLLKYLTTIDFGQLTTEKQILDIFHTSGLDLVQHHVIPGSVDTRLQAAYHSILRHPSSSSR